MRYGRFFLFSILMKKNLAILFIFLSFISSAQKIERFYDYRWKPCDVSLACFYSIIEFKDSLWSRNDFFLREKELQMKGSYRDSACKVPHGQFYYFHANGTLQTKGYYLNGKRQDLWLRFHSNGMIGDSTYYNAGKPVGTSMEWYPNGYMRDSTVYNPNGSAVRIQWFDNGNPSAAGRMINDSMHGKWLFYHKNGTTSAIEVYNRGILVSKKYFDESGKPVTNTSNRDREAEFGAGSKAWNKYMLSKLYFPGHLKINGADNAVVVISAIIDEDGNLIEPQVATSFHPAFDNIALKMMKESPKWKPAISHNRKVRQSILQPVTFAQIE